MNHITDVAVAAYLAGILDGEGSISIARGGRYHHLRIEITSSDTRLMTWLLALGGKVYPKAKSVLSRKPVFSWVLHGVDAETLLLAVKPYLVIKREQAEIGLSFRALKRRPRQYRLTNEQIGEREGLRQRMRVLHGKPA